MSNVETAIEEMIQSYVDEQDFVCRLDAEQYTDSEVNDARADFEGEITELQHRIEALEEKINPAAEEEGELDKLQDRIEALEARTSLLVLAQKEPRAESEEPRAVNQIDWILGEREGSTSIFAGYPTMKMLEQFVRSNLGTEEESKAMMIIMMTLATARNLINEKLEAES